MLKWAVNRQSFMPTVGEDSETTTTTTTTADTNTATNHQDYTMCRRSTTATTAADASSSRRRSLPIQSTAMKKLRRKSSDISLLRRKINVGQDKENQLTSTPLPLNLRNASPLRKLGSLKDLSNITPDKFISSPLHTPKKIQTPAKPLPHQYASTLPTFGLEYSPCELVPGPILALRGIGIADNYFEKPRYLTHEFNQKHEKRQKIVPPIDEESSLSSSKMGDLTLERMIDAILESARKERKIPKSKQSNHHPIMSPTYTPAEDPASDLHEFWDPQSEKYKQHDPVPFVRNCNFNEREVRTPESYETTTSTVGLQDGVTSCQLRRQRAVRRKRKITELRSNMKNSAQKILKRRSLGDRIETPKRIDSANTVRNISPDSGRNSSSDLEDSTLEAGNFTKRRLSFSVND